MPFWPAETRRARRRPLFCKAEAARDGTSAFHKGGRGLPPPPAFLFIKKGDTQVKKREKYKLNWAALLLAAALARADEIAGESGLDFPRLLTLEGAEFGDNGALRDIYPAFAPESTTYLFCSATSQTRGSSIDDIHVCDADGREKDGTIGEITAKGTELQLPTYEQDAVRRYDFGTVQETVMQDFPDYLRATVDGKSKILTGITEWRVDRVFGAPGTYAFTPVLPERYKNYTVVCDYPDIQVTVLPPAGDMNGDGAVSIADAELLAAYYNGTRQLAQVQLDAADHQTKADIRCSCIGLYPQLSEGGRRLELHGHRRIL